MRIEHVKSLFHQVRQKAIDGYTRVITALQKDGSMAGVLHNMGEGAVTAGQVGYLCLQCTHVSCGKDRHRKDHVFSVESSNGFVLCHECADFVYDPTFEEIRTSNSKKRKFAALQGDDKKLVSANTTTTPCAATGLRGLYNMGQTCFMSVILQSLIHNPLIRSFYLSEGHKSSECDREACTACALDDIFTDFYGQEKHEGYGAVHMLQGCWKGGGGLAGYSQQDAHEYLGFILNNLHTAITSDDDAEEASSKRDEKDCNCVIHQTFSGVLRSTVTCSACSNTTTALDPFMDLSLDIRSPNVTVKKKKLPLTNGTTTVKETLPMDLSECLDRFTAPETLSNESYVCDKCDGPREAKKRLRLERLAPVIPIHLKRFSHSKVLAQSNKVDTKIRFPLTLDLSPYLAHPSPLPSSASASPPKSTPAATAAAEEPQETSLIRPSSPVYVLSSVIVHKGKIDNGHYISYSRQGDDWYRMDDSMVVQVDEKEVLAAEGYMLVYIAREF
nr:isoform 2 of ubiquitin carboxyl-terminal hydrolase 22 [Quercus suber]